MGGEWRHKVSPAKGSGAEQRSRDARGVPHPGLVNLFFSFLLLRVAFSRQERADGSNVLKYVMGGNPMRALGETGEYRSAVEYRVTTGTLWAGIARPEGAVWV